MLKRNLSLVMILSILLLSQGSWAQAIVEVEGEVDVKANRITNVQDPLSAQDAATKAYVDSLVLSFGSGLGPAGVNALLNSGYAPSQIMANGASATDFIGLNYQGGIIFYVDPANGSGLIAAPTDQSTGTEWGCEGTSITGADGIAIGTGRQNTLAIITQPGGCATIGIAAEICHNLVLNGFDDWFLPSYGELIEMFNKIGPGAPIPNTNIGGFPNSPNPIYWSSSEQDPIFAWIYNFDATNSNGGTAPKSQNFRFVRAIRAFQ